MIYKRQPIFCLMFSIMLALVLVGCIGQQASSSREQSLQATLEALQTQVSQSGRAQPTSATNQQPTSITSPVPSPTLVTVPSSSPIQSVDTPANTILEIGQPWRQGEIALHLVQPEFLDLAKGWITLSFRLTNFGFRERVITFSIGNFSAVDNSRRPVRVGAIGNYTFTQDCPTNVVVLRSQGELYLKAGDCVVASGGWKWYVDHTAALEVNLRDASLKEIFVTANGISNIEGARWRIPINR